MASIDFFHGNALFAIPDTTFDITSVVAKRVGAFVNHCSFDTDGTMFALHAQGGTIVGWDHCNGADILQTATASLALQSFLDNLYGRNPSSTKAIAYFMGGDDVMTGSGRADVIKGLGGNDTVAGAGGNDRLLGGDGNDALDGGPGKDKLQGKAADDQLNGGAGADVLTGGIGADSFVFAAPGEGGDMITDFTPGSDKIALDHLTFGRAAPIADGVSFVSGAGATPVSAGATLLCDSTTGVLSFDADGTGGVLAIQLATLTNHALLAASDFALLCPSGARLSLRSTDRAVLPGRLQTPDPQASGAWTWRKCLVN